MLFGLLLPPAEVQIYIGGLKFTVARIGIFILLLPASFILLSKGRHLLACDFFVLALASWILFAAIYTDGTASLSSAGAESVEFFGGYIVARAFFFGAAALRAFVSVLKVVAFTAIIFAIADTVSGRLVIHHAFASLLHVEPISDQYRMGMVRAASTFDHAILFGAFCSIVAAILFYSEANVLKRVMYTGVCLMGAILSLSSSSLMGFAIILATYSYDTLLRSYPWRWSACWAAIGAGLLVIIIVTNKPLGWVLSNLTLDPDSGYFRLLIWDASIFQISAAPWTGHAFTDFGTIELNSVDSVWLVLPLRFGIPTIVFLALANLAAVLPTKYSGNMGTPYLNRMRTAFSLILLLFAFIGITVHYWNYIWIFWGICLGIRASLRELSLYRNPRSFLYSQPASNQFVGDRLRSPMRA